MTKRFRTTLRRRLCAAVLLASPLLATHLHANDRSGVWWVPAESGWGLFTVDQGNALLPTWFTYDAQGRASWFIVGEAFPQPDGSYSGVVFRYTGVPFAQIAGNAADPGERVGTARMSFPQPDRMRFEYSVGSISQTKTLDRFDWGDQLLECAASTADPAGFDNFTALWWNPSQDGWGLQLNHVGELLAGTWYTYGEDRQPTWFQFLARREADGRFRGELQRGRRGVPFSQIDGQPASQEIERVGSVELEFANGAQAVLRHTQGGTTASVQIQRAQFGSAVSQCRSRPKPVDTAPAGDECFPTLAVGDRFLQEDGEGGRIEQEVVGTTTYKGRPVFILEDRVNGDASATVREFIEQTATHRIYLGGEGYIASAQAQGTYEYDPPVEIPRVTPVGFDRPFNYVVRNRYTAMGMQVTADVQTAQIIRRVGSADLSVPAGSFSGACRFDNRLELDSTVQVAGFTVRSRTSVETQQWAHPLVGALRTENRVENRVDTTGAPVPVPPTITSALETSVLVEARVAGRNYP
ncbi:MAG: hypothetical protein MEQ07_00545 [Aquimonas sp.]|nr:hypothetical protein [Aquimonas sp.]